MAYPSIPDTDPANAGKVPQTYADEPYAWLQQRFGYTGSKADALDYFLALPTEQQGIFVRQIYYTELTLSGREFNDSGSKRYQSYLRGLNPIPEVPRGDIDLIAPLGTIDAGEAGIRVSDNVNLAALQVVNAANIQVQGHATGLPTVQGPPVAALTSASNTAAATQQTTQPVPSNTGATSVMIVEIIGYGGGAGDDSQPQEQQRNRHRQSSNTNYEPTGMVRILGDGAVTAEGMTQLTEEERRTLASQNDAPSPP